MSGVCIVNLKQHNLDEENLEKLARRLVSIALKNHIGVHFHCRDYGEQIIATEKMTNYFLISSTFLWKNCDFLNLQPFILKLYGAKNFEDYIANDKAENILSEERFRTSFYQEFKYFNEIIDCIFKFDVSLIEIYITPDYSYSFEALETVQEHFLNDLFESVVDELNNHFNYEFLNTKFILSKR